MCVHAHTFAHVFAHLSFTLSWIYVFVGTESFTRKEPLIWAEKVGLAALPEDQGSLPAPAQ